MPFTPGAAPGKAEPHAEPMDPTEGSCLPAATRAGCVPADGTVEEKALPTEERLRQLERHKERKEAVLEKHTCKNNKSCRAALRRLQGRPELYHRRRAVERS